MQDPRNARIAIIGLGYVGLPVALAFAKRFPRTIGFDVSARRVEALKRGLDETNEVEPGLLAETTLEATTDPTALRSATFFVVAVPTPLDARPAMARLDGGTLLVEPLPG